MCCVFFFFQAEDGIRDLVRSRGLGDVYKRQHLAAAVADSAWSSADTMAYDEIIDPRQMRNVLLLSLIHI